jgi:ribosomal protein S18 acetylase RimI-like enzyme
MLRQHSTQLTYRRIDPDEDALVAFAHYRCACIATYGSSDRAISLPRYVQWLKARVEEYPDGNVIAFIDQECVGQLELQAPYGLPTGYVNLFYVRAPFRRQGVGRMMHAYVEHYFRSWEVSTIELHVSRENQIASRFYAAMGYRVVKREGGMIRMAREL